MSDKMELHLEFGPGAWKAFEALKQKDGGVSDREVIRRSLLLYELYWHLPLHKAKLVILHEEPDEDGNDIEELPEDFFVPEKSTPEVENNPPDSSVSFPFLSSTRKFFKRFL